MNAPDPSLTNERTEVERPRDTVRQLHAAVKTAQELAATRFQEIERLRAGIQKHIDGYQAYDYCDVQEMRDLLAGSAPGSGTVHE